MDSLRVASWASRNANVLCWTSVGKGHLNLKCEEFLEYQDWGYRDPKLLTVKALRMIQEWRIN